MATEILVWSLLLIVGIIHAGNISMSYEVSSGSPDFYVGQTLTITCHTSGYKNISALNVYFTNTKRLVDSGCRKNSGSWTSSPFWLGFSTPADCAAISDPQGFVLQIQGVIAKTTVGYFYCLALDEQGNADQTEAVYITQAKVAPKDLIITVDTAIEGENLEFRCNSQSNSSSIYQYYIIGDSSIIETQPNVNYTVEESYRDGFSVKCVDIAHMHWRGGNTEASSAVEFSLYVAFNGSEGELREVNLDPLNSHMLLCDVIGNPSPEFTWTRNGVVLNETSDTLSIVQEYDWVNITEETVTEIIQKYNITGYNVTGYNSTGENITAENVTMETVTQQNVTQETITSIAQGYNVTGYNITGENITVENITVENISVENVTEAIQGYYVLREDEIITCTANVTGIAQPITVTWQIAWYDGSTVSWALSSQQPGAGSGSRLTKYVAIFVSLGISSLAIASVVGLLVVRKWRQNRSLVVGESTTMNRGSGGASGKKNTKGPVKGDPKSTEVANSKGWLGGWLFGSYNQSTDEYTKSTPAQSKGSANQSKAKPTKSTPAQPKGSANKSKAEPTKSTPAQSKGSTNQSKSESIKSTPTQPKGSSSLSKEEPIKFTKVTLSKVPTRRKRKSE